MEDHVNIVKNYYDSDVLMEWNRLEEHPYEFELTVRMMNRYIKPGDSILDIGGGPGRYSLYFAGKDCDVTLLDLSSSNVNFALKKAEELNVRLNGIVGDAREVGELVSGSYDHVFIMGPMYHLLDEQDRARAINSALPLLKEGGNLYVSFILIFSGMIYSMKYKPEMIMGEAEGPFIDSVIRGDSYGGDAFTKAFFINQKGIMPFMERFPLKKLNLFGQEGIMSPCEENFLIQPREVVDKWLDVAEKLCEREEFLGYAEHAMYIGRKESHKPNPQGVE